jgi:hypothetical protein
VYVIHCSSIEFSQWTYQYQELKHYHKQNFIMKKLRNKISVRRVYNLASAWKIKGKMHLIAKFFKSMYLIEKWAKGTWPVTPFTKMKQCNSTFHGQGCEKWDTPYVNGRMKTGTILLVGYLITSKNPVCLFFYAGY